MSQVLRIILTGCVLTGALTAMAMLFHSAAIEADIASRSLKALVDDGQGWGKVAVDGRDVTLKSTSPDAWSQAQARASVMRTFGVRILVDESEVLPRKNPFEWVAKRDSTGLTLSGYVPPYGEREAILEVARQQFPGIEITDNMALATGAPATSIWVDAVSVALRHLTKLGEGQVGLSGELMMSISGRAASFAGYDQLVDPTVLAHERVKIATHTVAPPVASPFVWRAQVDKAVTLSGYRPTVEPHQRPGDMAQAAGFAVDDQTRYAAGADERWPQWVEFAASLLPTLRPGEVVLQDNILSVSGQAIDFASHAVLRTALEGSLPEGLSLGLIAVRPPFVKPYQITFTLNKGRVVLAGEVPTPALQQRLKERLSAQGLEIADTLRLASGASQAWLSAQAQLAELVSLLEHGTITLRDETLVVKGVAASASAYLALQTWLAKDDIKGLQSVQSAVVQPIQSPFVLSMTYEENELSLQGFAPSPRSVQQLVAHARRLFPDSGIDVRVEVARGAPQAWREMTGFMLEQLALTEKAEVRLRDTDLTFRATAAGPQAYSVLVDALGGRLPDTMRLAESQILPPVVTDYRWQAVIGSEVASLSGVVPDKQARAQVLAHIKTVMPHLQVEDDSNFASGESEGWVGAIQFLLDQATNLEPGAVIELEKDTIHIFGRAISPESYLQIVSNLQSAVPKGYVQGRISVAAPVVERYIWRIQRDNGLSVLSGFIPSQAVRNVVNAAARVELTDTDVVDQMLIAEGAPIGVDWGAATNYALKLAARLQQGSVFLENDNISVEGEAKTIDDYRAILAAMSGNLPANLYLLRELVKPPARSDAATLPYTFLATFDGRNVTVDGVVRDAVAKAQLESLVADTFVNVPAQVSIDLLPRGRQGIDAQIKTLLRRLAASVEGRFRIIDDSLNFFAVVQSEAQATDVQAALVQETQIFTHANITIEGLQTFNARRASSCEAILNDFVRQHRIQFETASARLTRAGRGVLKRIIGSIARCPNTLITVEGHTDSDGDEAYNVTLSQQRAEAVVEYLRQAEIEPSRLHAIGYGEARPIASNDSAEGKSRNRRIEFNVVGTVNE